MVAVIFHDCSLLSELPSSSMIALFIHDCPLVNAAAKFGCKKIPPQQSDGIFYRIKSAYLFLSVA
jgi:hypothetical protein